MKVTPLFFVHFEKNFEDSCIYFRYMLHSQCINLFPFGGEKRLL